MRCHESLIDDNEAVLSTRLRDAVNGRHAVSTALNAQDIRAASDSSSLHVMLCTTTPSNVQRP